MAIPRGVLPEEKKNVSYTAVEISWGSRWVNLNDGRYQISAESRDSTTQSWRKTTATSPVMGGDFLVHAVPDMVSEQVGIWIRGGSQTELNESLHALTELFSQWDYRIRWTLDEYRETWRCQLADVAFSRGHVWTHNQMAKALFTVPRYPDVQMETLE